MIVKQEPRLPKGADRFLWNELPLMVPASQRPDYGHILKFDPSEARNPKGSGREAGRWARSPLEQKRRDFMALIKREDRGEGQLDKLRAGLNEAWKAWADDTKNRKKPLKPDGAAAKKLESYKRAKALEDTFHAQFAATSEKRRAFEKQAKEMLKVPVDQRSPVLFKEDPKAPLHPAVVTRAKQILETFKQFDGSGAFIPLSFPADKVQAFRDAFGDDTPLVQNKDGTYALESKLRLSKSESGRAHATIQGIAVGGRDLEREVSHEVAHHIEFKSHAVLQAAVALRESLANTPREVYSLYANNKALEQDEVAVRGNFPDPYSGKIYPQDISTEMVSTGVESYLSDPVHFARTRPEHFNFIFDVMHGKYRGQ
jgi:hypothetical protein